MIARLWHWLTTWLMTSRLKHKDTHMNRHWMADKVRISEYEAFTAQENAGAVVKNSAAFQREAFWANWDAKQRVKAAREQTFRKAS